MEMADHTVCLFVFISTKGNMFGKKYDWLTKSDKLEIKLIGKYI